MHRRPAAENLAVACPEQQVIRTALRRDERHLRQLRRGHGEILTIALGPHDPVHHEMPATDRAVVKRVGQRIAVGVGGTEKVRNLDRLRRARCTVGLETITAGAWLTGPLICSEVQPLNIWPSLAPNNRSSELFNTGTNVTCDSCAAASANKSSAQTT
jgi:hypothetical protein